jgi:hypothetical protein
MNNINTCRTKIVRNSSFQVHNQTGQAVSSGNYHIPVKGDELSEFLCHPNYGFCVPLFFNKGYRLPGILNNASVPYRTWQVCVSTNGI